MSLERRIQEGVAKRTKKHSTFSLEQSTMAETSSGPVQNDTDNEHADPANKFNEEEALTSPEEKVDFVRVAAEKYVDDEDPQSQVKEVAAPAAPGQDGDMMSVLSGASRIVTQSPRRSSAIATSAPNDRSYHPSRAKFYCHPRQRQRWGDTQILPRTNW